MRCQIIQGINARRIQLIQRRRLDEHRFVGEFRQPLPQHFEDRFGINPVRQVVREERGCDRDLSMGQGYRMWEIYHCIAFRLSWQELHRPCRPADPQQQDNSQLAPAPHARASVGKDCRRTIIAEEAAAPRT